LTFEYAGNAPYAADARGPNNILTGVLFPEGCRAAKGTSGTFSNTAQPGNYLRNVEYVEAALSSMDAKKMSMAKDMAAKGLAPHKAGKHGESLQVLHSALKELGIKH